jgi:GR25 family glycosyltransferase involved in LPS biosynthesis
MISAFVIHATHYRERKAHMLKMLDGKIVQSSFVLEGDKHPLNAEIIDRYFKGQTTATNAMSCSYKHLLAYQYLLAGNDEWAMVLKDDVFLNDNFNEELNQLMIEIKKRKINTALISLEDSSLTFVERSLIKKEYRLYEKPKGRMAGAYLIDRDGAVAILKKVEQEGCILPIDLFHNHCANDGVLKIYWTKSAVATQGSLSGRISSTLENKPAHRLKYFSFLLRRSYKKMSAFFR